jgi:G3E family GTPase
LSGFGTTSTAHVSAAVRHRSFSMTQRAASSPIPGSPELLTRFVRLDTLVTTVDVVHGADQLDRGEEAFKQAAIADRLLMTKTDLVGADQTSALRARLAQPTPGARIHTVLHGAIDPNDLFGAGLAGSDGGPADPRPWIQEDAYAAHDHSGDHHHNDAHLYAFCVTFEEPLSWDAVSDWFFRFRKWHGEHLLRAKEF